MKKTLLVFLGLALAVCGANAAVADDDAFENEMKAAIAQALTDADDAALEAAIAKAIEYDLTRGDGDAEDELEDGIEQALRAAGKTVDDATENEIEAAIERAYYKALRGAAQDANAAKGAAKAVKGAVKETFDKYNGVAAEEPAPTVALGAPRSAKGEVNASLKAALDQSYRLGVEDAFENAVEAAVAYALKNGNDATLKYAIRKALEYDAPTGDDDAGGAIEDGVEQALRLSGKRVTDRDEDMIEHAIERPYFRAMRDVERDANKLDAAADAIFAIVKTTFEKHNGGPAGKGSAAPAPAAPMNEAKEAIDLAMKSGNEDAIENAIEAAVADALQNGDDETLAYAIAKAIQFDRETRDDDGKGAVEDGVENALRALGKRVNDREEDEIESVVEKALHRRANADFAAKTVKGVFEKLNGGTAAAPKLTDAPQEAAPADELDAAFASGNEDAIEDAIKSAVAQALKTDDGDALEAVIAKAFDYDLNRGDDDAEDELEDGVERALRAAGKTVTDREENAIEATIERAYYKALRNARKNPDAVKEQVKAIKDAVKAAYDKFAA